MLAAMSGQAHGGNDSFATSGNASDFQNTFCGDAGGTMSGFAQGGNDTIKGGAPAGTHDINLAYGDALAMSGNVHGGNDKLVGGDDATSCFGRHLRQHTGRRCAEHVGWAVGGNDKLVSGTGNDDMWCDAQFISGNAKGGNDTYVFNFSNGRDKIEDFGEIGSSILGNDQIDVSALGIENFNQLHISAFYPTTHAITFSSGNDVVVHSQIALTSHDFLFA
jgi:hypothetical protein